ncbi:MAG: TrmH family RNA methyltransferase [Chitinophagaceae bacterium]
MLSKNEIKHIQTLYHKKQREEQGLFLVEGKKMAQELLNSNFLIKKIYATETWFNANKSQNSITTVVTEDELKKISQLTTPNEVLLVVEVLSQTTPKIFNQQLTLVVDDIQDPGNFGSIIRIADWFNIPQIICSSNTVDMYNFKVIQATMGSFLRVHIAYTNIESFLSNTNKPVYGALLKGKSIFETPLIKDGYLIIGNEGKGISATLQQYITNPITIPKFGGAESLNAAIATGIIVSHFK